MERVTIEQCNRTTIIPKVTTATKLWENERSSQGPSRARPTGRKTKSEVRSGREEEREKILNDAHDKYKYNQ